MKHQSLSWKTASSLFRPLVATAAIISTRKPLQPWRRVDDTTIENTPREEGSVAERFAETVANKCSRSVSLISRWCKRHRWVEGVAAFEAHLAAVEREATEPVARSKSAEWLIRQEELREVEWKIHEKATLMGERVLQEGVTKEFVNDCQRSGSLHKSAML